MYSNAKTRLKQNKLTYNKHKLNKTDHIKKAKLKLSCFAEMS